MITVEADQRSVTKLNAAIRAFIEETGREAGKVLKDQARLLVRDFIKATPPFGKHSFSENYNEQRRIGEAAVERDIRNVFIPVSVFAEQLSGSNPDLAYRILEASGISSSNVTRKKATQKRTAIDMDALDAIFRNMGLEGRVIRYANPDLHERAKGRRGRVKRATPYFVVSEKSIDNYIKEVKTHIGRAKAGWMRSAMGLALKGIPNWIKRHTTPGMFRDKSKDPNASITVGNLIEFSGDFDPRTFDAAMINRQRGMENQLKKMAEKQARKANSGSAI